MIDEDTPHDRGGKGEEVAAVLDLDFGLAEEADIEFMDERGGLECVVLAFPHESAAGKDAKLVIELFDEEIAGVGVARVPATEQFDGFVRGVHGPTT
jgi:hypothetical protein